eukprot:4390659-Pyramimonas_sp.AAC.1
MEPAELHECDLAGSLSSCIVHPEVKGTCATTASSTVRLLDYVVVSGGLSKGIPSTRVILESDLKTHTPVQIKFNPTLADIKFLTFSKPPVIPAQCPIGPCPEP